MSNLQLILEERPNIVGKFMVGRLLPFREKRTVGPFAFIDHMGPVVLKPGETTDIGAHPHTGLSTLTYLIEGNILHRDSLGTEIEIKPGEVNWMTAGKGIVHSEYTPERLKNTEKRIHSFQIWVALPKELEQMEPEFTHIAGDGLPVWEDDGVQYRLIAGEALGRKSAVPVYSPLYLFEIKSKEKKTINIGNDLFGESGLYILEGNVEIEGNIFGPKKLLVTTEPKLCAITLEKNTTIYIFGGEPFPEERIIYWNFVATSRELIEQAKDKWIKQEFPKIAGETNYIPLPPQNSHIKLK